MNGYTSKSCSPGQVGYPLPLLIAAMHCVIVLMEVLQLASALSKPNASIITLTWPFIVIISHVSTTDRGMQGHKKYSKITENKVSVCCPF